MSSRISVVQATTADDWESFHAIRRAVLWEARGRSDYDAAHPDDSLPDHYPLLLYADGIPAAAVRVDLLPDGGTAAMRRLAVSVGLQRNGLGSALLGYAESLAASKGCGRSIARVARDALGFWQRNGYDVDSSDTEASSGNPLVSKQIDAVR